MEKSKPMTITLRERLTKEASANGSAAMRAQSEDGAHGASAALQELKARLHRALISRMDLNRLNLLTPAQTQTEVARLAKEILTAEETPLSAIERDQMIEEVRHELFGLGPLEPLLADPAISDILVNSPTRIFIEREGKLERANVAFNDNDHVMRVIERIVTSVGRRIDESSPMVDARLSDGSRVNAVIPPVALDSPLLSIRRFGKIPPRINKLIDKGMLTGEIAELFKMCVQARLNIVISGGTGAGKTTLLNALSAYIPEDERIVTIEDSAELMLQQPHVVRMETRPRNIEGRGANTPRDALLRIETMIQMAGMKLSERAMRQQIASAIHLIIQVARMSDGARRITSISELVVVERK
jgi:pilus assembly protein CpaF